MQRAFPFYGAMLLTFSDGIMKLKQFLGEVWWKVATENAFEFATFLLQKETILCQGSEIHKTPELEHFLANCVQQMNYYGNRVSKQIVESKHGVIVDVAWTCLNH